MISHAIREPEDALERLAQERRHLIGVASADATSVVDRIRAFARLRRIDRQIAQRLPAPEIRDE